MNVDKFNSWLTLIANIGVLLGIIILIVELRQNTIATEAEVAWSHTNAAQAIWLPRAQDPEYAEFFAEMLRWTSAQVIELRMEGSTEYVRAISLISTILSYYQSRYYTQTTEDERQVLATHIRPRTLSPIYRYYLENLPDTWYPPEFHEFLYGILNE